MPTSVENAMAIRGGPRNSAAKPASSARNGAVRSWRTAPPAVSGQKPTNGMPTSSAARNR